MFRRSRLFLAAVVFAAATVLLRGASAPEKSLSDIQFQLAELLFADGRFDEALGAYERARHTDDPRQRLRAGIGLVKSALRTAQFARAQQEALALTSSTPRNPDVLALYGDTLWASGLFEESELAFRDALAIDPENARGRHGMARALAARSQLDAAMNEAQAALNRSPRDSEVHHTVGEIYERLHRFEEAATAYGNYLNLLPNRDRSDKAAWTRAEIRFLRSFGRRVPYEIENDRPDLRHTVPFKLVRDKVIVRGTINGSPEMELVLDTGAERTVVSRRTAQRLGISPIVYTLSAGVGDAGLRGLQVGRIDSLQIGTLHISNVPCLIKNPALPELPTRERDSFSPLALGLSMTIDYPRQMLTIGRKVPQEPADTELSLRLHRLAMVRGTVNKNRGVNFVVDTGGEVISISAATASTLSPTGVRRIPLKVYGSSGWDREAFLLPGVDLDFEKIRFRNFPVVVLDLRAPSVLLGFEVGGIVGHRFLGKYRVGIDLERSVVRLKEAD